MSPGEAQQRADFVIENDGNLDHLRAQAKAVYEALLTKS
jgi:dephospho-CoA kinase